MNNDIKKNLRRFTVNTNFFYLIPLVYSKVHGFHDMTLLIGLVFITSFFFHYFYKNGTHIHYFRKQPDELQLITQYLLWLDTIFAIILLSAATFVILKTPKSTALVWIGIALTLIASFIFLREKLTKKQCPIYHGFWHILTAISLLFILIAYNTSIII